MISPTKTWIITGLSGLLAGGLSLVKKAELEAVKTLDQQGAFNEIRQAACREIDAYDTTHVNSPDNPQRRKFIHEINAWGKSQKARIIHEHHADSFSGAWNQLSSSQRDKCLGFSSVISVAAGAIAYGIMYTINNPGRGDGSSSGGDGGGWWHGGGHDGGGHGGCDGGGGICF
jgi:hypothetical protein